MRFLLLAACSVGTDEEAEFDDAGAEAYYAAQEDDDVEDDAPEEADGPSVDTRECPPPACIQLAEGVDRGMVSIVMTGGGAFQLTNHGEIPVCLDRWYTLFSPTSQDAVGGVTTSLEIAPGEAGYLTYGDWGDDVEAWWCIEEDQYTAVGAEYSFNGADAPDLLQSYALDDWDLDEDGREDHDEWSFKGVSGAQHNIWNYLDSSPVVVVGRATNYYELTTGEAVQVEIEVTNLGRLPAAARVQETLPVGHYASAFTIEPSSQDFDEGTGATTYTFDVTMPAALDPQNGGSATYGEARIGYLLTYAGACTGREMGFAPSARWTDASGDAWVSAGADMVIECCADGGTFGD